MDVYKCQLTRPVEDASDHALVTLLHIFMTV